MTALPAFHDFDAWTQIRRETFIFWELIVNPCNGFSCPRCDHTALTPIPNHDELFCGVESNAMVDPFRSPRLVG